LHVKFWDSSLKYAGYSSPKYNDDISLLISQYLIPAETDAVIDMETDPDIDRDMDTETDMTWTWIQTPP
jgi:hypothetical protein